MNDLDLTVIYENTTFYPNKYVFSDCFIGIVWEKKIEITMWRW